MLATVRTLVSAHSNFPAVVLSTPRKEDEGVRRLKTLQALQSRVARLPLVYVVGGPLEDLVLVGRPLLEAFMSYVVRPMCAGY
jgi:hypothetical protein